MISFLAVAKACFGPIKTEKNWWKNWWSKLMKQIGETDWWNKLVKQIGENYVKYSPSHSTNHVMPMMEHLLVRQQSLFMDGSSFIMFMSHFVKFSDIVTFMTQANTISRISAICNRKWSYWTTVYLVKMESGSEIAMC